mgnify:CR=1 FL=1
MTLKIIYSEASHLVPERMAKVRVGYTFYCFTSAMNIFVTIVRCVFDLIRSIAGIILNMLNKYLATFL